MAVRAPVCIVHFEVIRRSGDKGGPYAVILEAFSLAAVRPDKNEDYACHEKHVRYIGLFKECCHLHY